MSTIKHRSVATELTKKMKSALIFLTLFAVALSAQVPVSKPAQQELHGRPLMHPEQKSSQGQQSLQCYEQPNQQGSSVR